MSSATELIAAGYRTALRDALKEIERQRTMFADLRPPGFVACLDELQIRFEAMEQRGSYSSKTRIDCSLRTEAPAEESKQECQHRTARLIGDKWHCTHCGYGWTEAE